jgi:hypothetical protein
MSAKSVVAAVTGFLSHHIGDLNNIADVLGELTNSLPIDSQDKDRVGEVIGGLKSSADNIANFLNGTKLTGGEVVVKESDIVEALANFFATDAGKAALKSAEGNANG